MERTILQKRNYSRKCPHNGEVGGPFKHKYDYRNHNAVNVAEPTVGDFAFEATDPLSRRTPSNSPFGF